MSNFEQHFKNETILQKTKNTVNNLINYNDEFKNNVQYPGEPLDEYKIKQLLHPVYDKIYQIKADLLLFSELNSQNTSKSINTKKLNEIQHLHTNILYNKNIIDDTLNYMKEKLENVNYEQINKEFQEIELTLENLKKEMEDMVEEFDNKYDKIIKEKKRQKIAEDIIKGNYNKAPEEYNKGLGISTKLKYNLKDLDENDEIDYDKYKYDIDEIDKEKEYLMLKYLEDKQKAINGLPKMVPAYQKVNFNYDVEAPNFKNINNNKGDYNDNNFISSENKEINNVNNNINSKNINNNENNINKNEPDNIIKDIDYNENNNNNNNNLNNLSQQNYNNNINNNRNSEINGQVNNINNDNNVSQINNNHINNQKKENDNKYININSNNNINLPKNYYMNSDYNNANNNINDKDNMDPTETLNNFKEKMSQASKAILTGPSIINKQPPHSKKKFAPKKEAYNSYKGNNQMKSSGSKITYQNFNKPKKPRQKGIKNEDKKKPYKFITGKYPDDNEKNRINDFMEKNPPKPGNKNLKVFEQENLEEEIKRIVDINIKNAINIHQLNKGNIESSRIRKNNSEGHNDELLKLLINKFEDIENAIRETKNNNNNGIEFKQDINEILANEIFNKIYAQINYKLNIKKKKEESEGSEEEEESEKIIQKKEVISKKIIEEPKNINIFNENINTDLKDLDEVIPAPRDLNLNKYNNISMTSEDLTQSIKQKPDINMNNNNQIEITNININRNKLLFNNNEINYNDYLKKKNIENSLSEGEERSNLEESSQSDYNKNNKYNTAKGFMPHLGNKNKTGNDLLMLKYSNENLPEFNFNNNKIMDKNLNNKEEMNLNNGKLLEKMGIYDSGEYNVFKNKFKENMNNNKTLTNFGSMPNNQNILDDDVQNLKILKHEQKEIDEIKHKIELLKLKDEQDNEDNNINNIDTNNYINNNFNNHFNNINNNIIKDDEGYSSPGEVRSEDSY